MVAAEMSSSVDETPRYSVGPTGLIPGFVTNFPIISSHSELS